MGIVYMQQLASLKSECADTFHKMCRHIETKVLALFAKSVITLKKTDMRLISSKESNIEKFIVHKCAIKTL